MNWSDYRAYLRHMIPEITDEDIKRLQTFAPKVTPMALAIFRAYPPKDQLQ